MAPLRRFGTTWWGRAWLDALEHSGSSYQSRLPRGLSYARKGAVRELEVAPGHLAARVVGSTGELYRVDLAVRRLAMAEWEQVADAVAAKAAHLAALLDGELDPGVVADAAAVDVALLPRAADVRPDCSCPDWAEPCKHAAAVCFLAAAEMDRDPFALFTLRGMTRDEFVELVRTRRSLDHPGGGRADPDADPDMGADPDRDAAGTETGAGMSAAQLWTGRSIDEPLGELPEVLTRRPPLRRPGRRAPWDASLPDRFGIDPARLDELAEDTVERAWAMLVEDRPSGLAASARADLARRAAAHPDDVVALAARAGLTPGALRIWAEAWDLGGDVAVEVVASPETWSTDQDLLSAGRAALEEIGHPRRSISLNYDSLLMASTVWLVLGPDRRWYRLHGPFKHQDLHLVAPPSSDVRDLVDPPR